MRRSAFLLSFLVFACAHGGANGSAISGWVSDAMCGAEHVGGKNASCVTKCLKGGAAVGHPEWEAQAMVLVVDGSERILVVDNPDTLISRAAQHVRVRGTVAGDHLHVDQVLD
jgi:hypothetical protein